MVLTYILLTIYIISLIYIGIKDHNSEDKEGFIIADRKVGIIGTLSSLSASLRTGGGMMVLIGGGFILKHGFYNLGLGSMLSAFVLGVIAPRVRKIAKEKGYITINQMVRDSVGICTEKVSSTIVLIFTLLGVAAQLYVLGKIVNTLLNIDSVSSILISVSLVGFYVCLGGYKSIIKTDILQFIIMLSCWLILFYIPVRTDVVFDISRVYTSQPLLEFISGIMYGAFLMFAYGDFWQRIFSSKDDRTARISCGCRSFLVSYVNTFNYNRYVCHRDYT